MEEKILLQFLGVCLVPALVLAVYCFLLWWKPDYYKHYLLLYLVLALIFAYVGKVPGTIYNWSLVTPTFVVVSGLPLYIATVIFFFSKRIFSSSWLRLVISFIFSASLLIPIIGGGYCTAHTAPYRNHASSAGWGGFANSKARQRPQSLAMVERYGHQNGAHIEAAMDKLENRYNPEKVSNI